jgi:hypothetical protein
MAEDDRLRDDAARSRQVDLDALFAAVDRETRDSGGARALTTSSRRAGLLGAAVAVAAAMVVWQGHRPWEGRLAAEALALGVPGLLGLWYALRPMHAAPARAPWLPFVVLASITLAAAFGGVLHGEAVTPAPAWEDHVYCGRWTTGGAILVGVAALAAERGGLAARWRLALVAAACGLVGFAAQNLVCPVVDPVHLALSHAAAGLPVAALLWATPRR